MRNVFCDTTGWNNFKCTDVPEGSGAKAHISEAFSGCILSSQNLLDDPSIKHRLESETQPLIGVEMEGWVLFEYINKSFPKIESLIIKGICDYGDGTKIKTGSLWQQKLSSHGLCKVQTSRKSLLVHVKIQCQHVSIGRQILYTCIHTCTSYFVVASGFQ